MDIKKIYDELSSGGLTESGNAVKVSSGLFTEKDLINVFSGGNELKLMIDKAGFMEVMNIILTKIQNLSPKDDFNHMIDVFNLIQGEINNYYGTVPKENRLVFYMKEGMVENDINRICTLSQIKGLGIAKCAEKAALANNILLMLNKMNLFSYPVKFLNALISFNESMPDGHAFLEFSRTNKKGELVHLIYDVSNPEIVVVNGQDYFYPAIYSLQDIEYEAFLGGEPFDNTKFILFDTYQLKEKRVYSGFNQNLDIDDFPIGNNF